METIAGSFFTTDWKRGLEATLSPYLFVICMEVLSACLKRVETNPEFGYHWKCKENSISNLMFADDVLLFCKGEVESIKLLLSAVNCFGSISGLSMNSEKSLVFFANVPESVKSYALETSGYQQGTLPVKYLGLPLITGKLTVRDCNPLIIRICNHIDFWASKCLNHAGRLQLLKVILFGIQAYWSSHLYLPKHVLKKIQSYFGRFLWGGGIFYVKKDGESFLDGLL